MTDKYGRSKGRQSQSPERGWGRPDPSPQHSHRSAGSRSLNPLSGVGGVLTDDCLTWWGDFLPESQSPERGWGRPDASWTREEVRFVNLVSIP